MGQKQDIDPLQEWGPEAAVVAVIVAILAALGIVIYTVMRGGNLETAALPALGVVVAGGIVAFAIMAVRKRRERARRPKWMGSTQEWREGLLSRQAPGAPPSQEKPNEQA